MTATSNTPTSLVAGQIITRVLNELPILEAELKSGLLREWRDLIDRDPHGSLFQSPGWCMPWFRCYQDEYRPHVILVSLGAELVGIVPMAVHLPTNELVFASGHLPDYGDVITLPELRRTVVAALIESYLAGGFSCPLRIGWFDPTSPTRALLTELCEAEGLHTIERHQPCYRWYPPPPKKPSAQKFLNWYQRQGTVSFDIIASEQEWVHFRDEYYRSHSLRQIQAGRPIAFNDPRKRAFYDQLFQSTELQTHVTALRVNGTIVAGHFGYLWRDVLLLGPPCIRLREEQRSPAVILFSWIIQNAADLGLAGFDLTIGDSDFKKRLGNHCVQLTAVDIYRKRPQHFYQSARTRLVATAHHAVDRFGGEGTWKSKVKPAAEWLHYKRQRVAELGLPAAGRAAVAGAVRTFVDFRTGLVYAMKPTQLRPIVPSVLPGETFEVHDDCPDDLLRCCATSTSLSSLLTESARNISRIKEGTRTFHSILLNGELAGMGYSYWATEPASLTETPGAVLDFEPGSVSLYDFHTIPKYRGRRLYQALLTHILQLRFAEGARRAYIGVLASNVASRAGIERVGFRLVRRNKYRRIFTTRWLHSVEVADG